MGEWMEEHSHRSRGKRETLTQALDFGTLNSFLVMIGT